MVRGLAVAESSRGDPPWTVMPKPHQVKDAPLTGRSAKTVIDGRTALRAIPDWSLW